MIYFKILGPSHQIVPAQYIMTPQGLVQALPAPAQAQQVLLPTSADQQLIMPRTADSPQLLLPAQHFGGSHGAMNKNVTKVSLLKNAHINRNPLQILFNPYVNQGCIVK